MTAPDEQRTPTTCVGCGQTDDHPKLHHLGVSVNEYGIPQFDTADTADTYHHDCFPFGVNGVHAQKVVKAAKDGKRGDALRAYIQKTAPTPEG
jgi:hypothetical protein